MTWTVPLTGGTAYRCCCLHDPQGKACLPCLLIEHRDCDRPERTRP